MQRSLASQTVESQRSTGLAVGQPAVFILSSDTDRTARLRERAQRRGCLVREASDVLTAMSVLDADSTIGVAFIDGDSAWFNGLQVIERLKRTHTRLSWVLVACEPHPVNVIAQLLVFDYLQNPLLHFIPHILFDFNTSGLNRALAPFKTLVFFQGV